LKLIVGLGNPGPRYQLTRHNAGFMAVDLLAEKWQTGFDTQKHKALLAEARINQERVQLAKPLTFMNLSGEAVGELARYYKIDLADILVIYDDLDLEVGKLRLRPRGQSGGHKGMASVMEHLRSEQVARLKIGIGRPEHGGDTIRYVLSPFDDRQWQELETVWERVLQAVEVWLREGLETAMNRFNGA